MSHGDIYECENCGIVHRESENPIDYKCPMCTGRNFETLAASVDLDQAFNKLSSALKDKDPVAFSVILDQLKAIEDQEES